MKLKELLKGGQLFLSDIVDQNNYIIRKNEKIIKSNNPDIGRF
ncbi:MAG: hypothetical protein CM15mP63_4850 [Gammaproteobacteria bacterium]|nr:MAG: hypothetical protein CM15mP63_4850 [Gammaproteobacteria bacterium]